MNDTHPTIALAGNPNCGKTTLFNALTGARQHVGNWPGVTVERIEGAFTQDDTNIKVVDLPGIYSLSASSMDERIARDFLLKNRPAVVVNIIDATNLRRNLFLTTQLLELRVPMVVALNMMDIVRQRKLHIEIDHLAEHLGCPVIALEANRKKGVDALRRAIVEQIQNPTIPSTQVAYDMEVEEAIESILPHCAETAKERNVPPRWLALHLLENDPQAHRFVGSPDDEKELEALLENQRQHIERHVGEDIDVVIHDGRYGFIAGLVRDVLHRRGQLRRTLTDIIDTVMLNRLLGIPLFLLVMYFMFWLTIDVAGPFIDFFDQFTGALFVDGLRELLTHWGWGEFWIALLADGIGGGLQTVSTFIPPIFFIFLCLAILEDSGYMARGAFVMDRLMRMIGLPGKAFLPMLMGFGCNVPAILATRTLENRRDRIMAVLMNPFMSCGARLPVYTLFAIVFFKDHAGLVVFSIYLTGIVLSILTGLLLKNTLLQGEPTTFVMELPAYHVPTLSGIMHHTWNRLKSFIIRAGKIIVLMVIIFSFLNAVQLGPGGLSIKKADDSQPLLAGVGKTITPVFEPMGLDENNWQGTVGLFTGVFAKEAVIGTLNSLYLQTAAADSDPSEAEEPFHLGAKLTEAFQAVPDGFKTLFVGEEEEDVEERMKKQMRSHFHGPIGALAYMLFVLIYMPCLAAVAAMARETSRLWAAFGLFYLTALAWLVATTVYQIGTFGSHPGSSSLWIAGCGAILGGIVVTMRRVGKRIRVEE